MINDFEDQALLKKVANGCQVSFEKLYHKFQDRITGLVYKILHSTNDLNDVMNDTFFHVWRSAKRFKGKSQVGTWIYRIAANECFMILRNRRRKKQLLCVSFEELDIPTKLKAVEDHYTSINALTPYEDEQELQLKLVSSLRKLPSIYKNVFFAQIIDGLDAEEVNAICELTTPARKSRIMRARRFLTKLLKDEGNELKERLVNYRRAA